MSGSWPFSEMAAWRSLKSSRFSTRSCKRSTVLVSASTFCNTAVSLISFFPVFHSIHLDGVPRQQEEHAKVSNAQPVIIALGLEFANIASQVLAHFFHPPADVAQTDRKSTRLNSSHANISYAVFCLKKKKKHITENTHNS